MNGIFTIISKELVRLVINIKKINLHLNYRLLANDEIENCNELHHEKLDLKSEIIEADQEAWQYILYAMVQKMIRKYKTIHKLHKMILT